MLDIQLIRRDADRVAAALRKRGVEVDFASFLQEDQERRRLLASIEEKRSERNRNSALIPQLKKQGEDCSELLARMKTLAQEIKDLEQEQERLDQSCQDFLDRLPNMPADDVPAGNKEANEVVEVYGEKPHFDFEPLDHVTLAERLHLIDYQRGAKLGGAGFWIYTGLGARLEWALLNYFTEQHLKDGYEMQLLPHLLLEACGYTAGQFPKFRDDVFWLENQEGSGEGQRRFLLPTAETALVNLHRDEILEEAQLPLKYFGYTPCFRKEAGSYRSEERGMIRGHQFNKVEIFQYCTPEQGEAAFEGLLAKAGQLVAGLNLHYRVSRLAAADISASMAKTYDIEIWIPSMEIYKEVSSASIAHDYQARRGRIRYRRQEDGKVAYCYTLNASGLATSRVFPALLEQNQTPDGRVRIPEVLRPWMGGMTYLEP